MPRWFRLVVTFACPVLWLVQSYVKPGHGFAVGSILMLLSLAAGVSAIVLGLYDRQASGVDDPTTLNLHR
ncbi:MAG TPA: hypothetical protein VFV95_16965 [Vicinamibacterales bacterium]|nr:hypothetical protein [Vicinamibacterales bacterium]